MRLPTSLTARTQSLAPMSRKERTAAVIILCLSHDCHGAHTNRCKLCNKMLKVPLQNVLKMGASLSFLPGILFLFVWLWSFSCLHPLSSPFVWSLLFVELTMSIWLILTLCQKVWSSSIWGHRWPDRVMALHVLGHCHLHAFLFFSVAALIRFPYCATWYLWLVYFLYISSPKHSVILVKLLSFDLLFFSNNQEVLLRYFINSIIVFNLIYENGFLYLRVLLLLLFNPNITSDYLWGHRVVTFLLMRL